MKKKILSAIMILTYVFLLTSTVFADDNQSSLNLELESQTVQPLANEFNSFIIQSGDTGVINTNGVRIRSTPSLSGTVLGLLYIGDEVEVGDGIYHGDGYAWYHISSFRTGISGYVVVDYVDIVY